MHICIIFLKIKNFYFFKNVFMNFVKICKIISEQKRYKIKINENQILSRSYLINKKVEKKLNKVNCWKKIDFNIIIDEKFE